MIFEKATVYGGGLIGSGWATAFLLGGVEVTVFDINEESLKSTEGNIDHILEFFASPEINVLTAERKDSIKNRVHFTTNIREAVEDAVFIQENGPEKLEIKQSIIKAIEEYNTDAIIATSTSGLRITDIAREARYPGRIIAGHPFNPVHLMPLVELCKGELTDQGSIDCAFQFYTEIGKVPVVLNSECKGFICNRIQSAINREVQDLVYRGVCSVEDIDKAVTFGIGLRLGLMGPHMILELGGGPGGISSNLTRYKSEGLNKDLATWTVRPTGYQAIAEAGTAEELRRRRPEQGNDHDSLERFRDRGLVYFLKYHDML